MHPDPWGWRLESGNENEAWLWLGLHHFSGHNKLPTASFQVTQSFEGNKYRPCRSFCTTSTKPLYDLINLKALHQPKPPPLNQSQSPWVLCGLKGLAADTPAEESSSTGMALAAHLSDSPLADSAASARVSYCRKQDQTAESTCQAYYFPWNQEEEEVENAS
ncbi:uncharacterized protein BDZ99DRAFT_95544 [Mytilinidion resinicola]|uniref:Uncharacterized protein n=1 Tax=Mytilinidion resinicola TaxID=574789 RepID=A0A6A6YD77_9PEZI|nr:uncharacterized protein BDZ99DRAFT_95544 [Mytilinidion resinicola]KAF2806473.1 hypothetical protein BDZ99DRAFT_95544 [Mytilinidion resinicola]